MKSCMNVCAQLPFPLHSSQSPAHYVGLPIFRVGIPTSVNPLRKSFTGTATGLPNLDNSLRRLFQVIVHCVKLTKLTTTDM